MRFIIMKTKDYRLHLVALCWSLLFVINLHSQTAKTPLVSNSPLQLELLKMVEADQAIRNELIKSGVEHPDKKILKRMDAIDTANLARVKAIIKRYGFPTPKLVGKDGVEATFLLIQHGDLAFQKQMLPFIKNSFRSENLSGQNYALLLDRVLIGEGKPQVYGTQGKPFDQWKGKEPALQPIEDEANVDKRRAEVGLPPLSEYIKFLKQMYFPEKKVN